MGEGLHLHVSRLLQVCVEAEAGRLCDADCTAAVQSGGRRLEHGKERTSWYGYSGDCTCSGQQQQQQQQQQRYCACFCCCYKEVRENSCVSASLVGRSLLTRTEVLIQ